MTNFNAHHKIPSIKSLVIVAENGALIGVAVGWGGNEADIGIFQSSELYQNIVTFLSREEKFFVGDGSFRDGHTFYPLSRAEIMAANVNIQPRLRVYNRELQLHRARVEHAIGHAKARWGALREIPGIYHMSFTDIIELIFASWLLEARFQRVHNFQ